MLLDDFNLLAVSSTFLLVLLAEMGDKTQIMTLTLAARYRDPVQVFIGAFLGETVVSFIGIAVGITIASIISVDIVSRVAGVVFILFGLVSILKKESNEEVEKDEKSKSPTRILMVFSMIAAAEMGDKTQLAIIALAVEYNSPISVALGVAAGFAVLSIIAVVLGRSISKIIPISLIQKIAAVTFLAIGATLVLGVV